MRHGNGTPDTHQCRWLSVRFLPINNHFCHLCITSKTVLLLQPLPLLHGHRALYVRSNDVWRPLLKYDSLCNLKSSKRINRFRGFFLFSWLSRYLFGVGAGDACIHRKWAIQFVFMFPIFIIIIAKNEARCRRKCQKGTIEISRFIEMRTASNVLRATNDDRINDSFIYF